jgi:hypothetical protein
LFAEIEVDIANVELRAAQPYLEPFVALNLAGGALETSGKVRFQTMDTSAPMLTFAGGMGVTNLLTDQVAAKEFARWDDFTLSGIELGLSPNRLKIGEVRLVRPKAGIILQSNKQSNLSLILKKSPPATNAALALGAPPLNDSDTSSNSSANSPYSIDTVRLEQVSFGVTDETIQPNSAIGIQELSGTVKDLSSTQRSPATVDLHGRIDEQSPFAIVGRINPSPEEMFVDLTITNANTQLVPLTGYMEKYGGYPLVKGRLSTSLHYHVEEKTLKAENKIHVDQLTLGARNNSPDATSLPVKLGVALLKDNNGRIALDVPVSGKIDDPQFKVGGVIAKVIGDMIVKAAASPFKLLGSIVGVDGEQLSFVAFTPGSTNMVEGELDKLSKLTGALENRPSLNVEIEGAIDPVADRRALCKLKLGEQLKARYVQELATKGDTTNSIETVEMTPTEHDRLLRIAFIEEFGTNIAAIVSTNAARLIATNQTAVASPPKAKGGLIQRFWGVISSPFAAQAKTEKRLSKADREALSKASPQFMEELLAEKVEIPDTERLTNSELKTFWVHEHFLCRNAAD